MVSLHGGNEATGRSQHLDGLMTAHHLQQWWSETFSEDERELINARFQLNDEDPHHPASGRPLALTTGNAASLLNSLAGRFNNPGERDIARRMAGKAAQLSSAADNVPDLHFSYLELVKINARDRHSNPEALAAAIEACEHQIELAPRMARIFGYPGSPLPPHLGYETLATIREEQGELVEALRLAVEAKEQGWLGRWDERISRLREAMVDRGRTD